MLLPLMVMVAAAAADGLGDDASPARTLASVSPPCAPHAASASAALTVANLRTPMVFISSSSPVLIAERASLRSPPRHRKRRTGSKGRAAAPIRGEARDAGADPRGTCP